MYYTIQNGQILTAENKGALAKYYDNLQILPSDYEIGKYIVENNSLVMNPKYETEQAQKKAERISKLYLTGADVERGIYQAKGMDFDDIIALISEQENNNLPDKIDLKALKIELKANHFYRGNPYVNAVGSILGFSSNQLDKFFETNDYTFLLEVNDNEQLVL